MIRLDQMVISPDEFPDNTPRYRSIPIMRGIQYEIHWNYESMDELITVLMLAGHIHDCGSSVSLRMPYVPNARMDRVHGFSEIFTLRHFCRLINDAQFVSVHILDPHSHVTPALLDRVVVHTPEDHINHALSLIMEKERARPFVVYPDEGASKRYSLDIVDAAFGIKKRNWDTGKIEGLVLNGRIPPNRPALIVDDICSYGGTFVCAAKELRKVGVENIYLYVTHCEENIFAGEVFSCGLIKKVFTTDSIMTPDIYSEHAPSALDPEALQIFKLHDVSQRDMSPLISAIFGGGNSK